MGLHIGGNGIKFVIMRMDKVRKGKAGTPGLCESPLTSTGSTGSTASLVPAVMSMMTEGAILAYLRGGGTLEGLLRLGCEVSEVERLRGSPYADMGAVVARLEATILKLALGYTERVWIGQNGRNPREVDQRRPPDLDAIKLLIGALDPVRYGRKGLGGGELVKGDQFNNISFNLGVIPVEGLPVGDNKVLKVVEVETKLDLKEIK